MKKTSVKMLALLLTLVMLLSAVPFASAVCAHTAKEPWYVPNGEGFHTTEKCSGCGETFGKEACSGEGVCGWCGQTMPAPTCQHDSKEPWYVPNGKGYHTTEKCSSCTETFGKEACVDASPEDGKCDKCGQDIVESGLIICSQNGTETGSNSLIMNFSLRGVTTNDIDWTFSVSGSADPNLSNKTASGSTASVNVYTNRGNGVAKVTATAKWGSGKSASDTFVVSFYDRVSTTVYLKNSVSSFRFTDRDVFSKINGYSTNNIRNYSLYSIITDGCADRVSLYESKSGNYRIGEIYSGSSSRFNGYDEDDYNDYAISGLSNLHFRVKGEGTYELKFEAYEMVGGKGYATSRGTIDIVTGNGSYYEDDYTYTYENGVTYKTGIGKSVKLSSYDFERYWDNNYDGYYYKSSKSSKNSKNSKTSKTYTTKKTVSKSGIIDYLEDYFGYDYDDDYYYTSRSYSRYEDLKYVKFSVGSGMKGELFRDNKQKNKAKSSDKYYVSSAKSYSGYDLDDLVYVPADTSRGYTEEIDFVAYGDEGGSLKGTLTIVVSDSSLFVDVSSTDWFYDEVMYVYNKGIMNGVENSRFAPNACLTRAMVVTMLYRVAGEPNASGSKTFRDVADGAWYAKAVAWAAANKIVKGVSDTKFAPDANITREQLAAILYRYAEYKKMKTNSSADLDKFTDAEKVSDYAVEAMEWAVGAKIMEGTGSRLNPTGTATRAEAAAMFCRFLQK